MAKAKSRRQARKKAAKPRSQPPVEVEKKSLVLVDYTVWVKESGEVFDTTNEETAKSSGIFDPSVRYGPRLVFVGAGWYPEHLEELLKGRREGEEFEAEVPPEKAYGQRDPSKLRVVPMRRLLNMGIKDVRVGSRIFFNGAEVTVRSVGAGRVVLDYNHPLAGKTLHYKIKIVKIIREYEEKVRALLDKWFARICDPSEVSFVKKNGDIEITIPEAVMLHPELQSVKRALADDLFDVVSPGAVIFVEKISKSGEAGGQ